MTMNMGQDILVLTVGLGFFALFLLVHFILFRSLKPEQLLKAIMLIFAICFISTAGIGFMILGWWMILSLVIYGGASFFYILCIFGPYETSIRMRLIREIALDKNGISLQDLLRRYNTEVILDIRLKRLMGAGDLTREGGHYHMHPKPNAFFMIDAIAQRIHAFIHRS